MECIENLQTVFVNAGRGMNSLVSTHVVLEAVAQVEPAWGAVFISETDGHSDIEYSAQGRSMHLHIRHQPPNGWAMPAGRHTVGSKTFSVCELWRC